MVADISALATSDFDKQGARAETLPMAMPASGRRWVLRQADHDAVLSIERELSCPRLLATVLAGRGVKAGEAKRLLFPSLRDDLPDPSTLTDMDRAAERIATAIIDEKKCGVFGDYDVDGTSGSAILKKYFDDVGADLAVYLPDRMLEGYGPSVEAFRTLRDEGATLIMTVDCGAAAHHAIDAAAGEGMEIIVLDHHQMDGPPPNGAYATVNPNRPDDASGLNDLSAAGVAFMAAVAINRTLRARGFFKERAEPNLLRLLDLTALGLVCDVMPMTGVARLLTAQGLKALESGGNPGLVELRARAGATGRPTTYDLGFVLGPRINAAGRIGHARLAFELLTTADPARRSLLAERLHVMNAERQEIERSVLDAAIAAVERKKLHERAVIVVADEGWHPGVIGIVAGRLKDRFERPSVVISLEGETGKGSARSLPGVDLGAAVRAAKKDGLLVSGGGHEMAAGLTIERASVERFADMLNNLCRDDVSASLANRTRNLDALIAASAVTAQSAHVIADAGPFGPGNPEPVFLLPEIRVSQTRIVGGGHVACDLVASNGEAVRAIAFRAAGEPLGDLLMTGRRVHLAGRIKADTWRGGDAGQFQIVDAAEAV
ncbi:MAG: single-stranded-DNA-specific exonuclease RecJ [Parvularculaceae bacterium]|nr:single-stranded-DNA-specific exonuclease RecJ [Parvularculaceae bacterium]